MRLRLKWEGKALNITLTQILAPLQNTRVGETKEVKEGNKRREGIERKNVPIKKEGMGFQRVREGDERERDFYLLLLLLRCLFSFFVCRVLERDCEQK